MANIQLGGSVSTTGTAILGSYAVVFSSDANHTLSVAEYTNQFLSITSSVSLTTQRDLIAPLVEGQTFIIKNSTSGSQSIRVIGASGTGVVIANGTIVSVVCDGTNYISNSGVIFSGDLSGTPSTQTVIGLQNNPISAITPFPGQALIWDGYDWTPSSDFATQNITTSGSITAGPISGTSLTSGLMTLSGKLIINAIGAGAVSDPNQGIIYYDSTNNYFMVSENGGAYQRLGVGAITFSGDLSGTFASQTVIGLRNNPIRNVSPAAGQSLIWDGYYWTPSSDFVAQNITTTGSFTSGPLSSTSVSTGLFTLGGKFIANAVAAGGVSDPSQGIIYFDSSLNRFRVSENSGSYVDLVPTSLPPSGSAGGDLSGSYPNPTVAKANGATVPAAGSLTTGNVLQVSGSSALSYGPINLAGGSNYVSGVLPVGNQADQIMGGDVSGTTGSATVIKIRNNPVLSQSLSATEDGYVLTWINADGYWEAKPTGSPSGSAGGDLSGSYPNPTVAKINGTSVPSSTGVSQGAWLSISGANAAQWGFTPVLNVSTNHTAASSEYLLLVDTSSTSITITLPSSTDTGRIYTVKDSTGNASTNNIIVSSSASIDGSGSFTMAVNYSAANFVFNGTSWNIV